MRASRPLNRACKRRPARAAWLGLAACAICCTLGGCARGGGGAKASELPAPPGHAAIDVVLAGGHSYIAEPIEPPPGAKAGEKWWREWEYCEVEWYLRDGDHNVWTALRAMLWPSRGAVGCPRTASPVWTELPAGEFRRWTFIVTDGELAAMRRSLEAQRGEPLADYPGWFIATRSYHLFHHCHHFTAEALRAAGVPTHPALAMWGGVLGRQLDGIAGGERRGRSGNI